MTELTIITTPQELTHARKQCWQSHITALKNNQKEHFEFENHQLIYGDISMKFYMTKKGNPGPDGYPVYIALHGGGGVPFPEINDRQWEHQKVYYFDSVTDGICIAPRGVRDTWNTHFNDESYPLYDRLIMNLAAHETIDFNRIYLLGFSAGGDGVYGITPCMADRFAAANMSAGHPNSVDLTNLYHLPLSLQVGEKDGAYERNHITARYGLYLNRLALRYGDGYIHRVLIHSQKPHNFRDNEPNRIPQTVIADYKAWILQGNDTTAELNTNAIDFVNQFTRDPLPRRIVWNLATRAPLRKVNSHYWLWADPSARAGHVVASYNSEDNSITIEENTANGEVRVLINEDMLDVFAPITIHYPDHTETVTVEANLELLWDTTLTIGDPNYQFCASITLSI
ncbi:MAG: hypothetical protein ACI4C1_04385 [Lachnospiraceae bacterium]